MQQPKIIELPKFTDPRGNLSFLENDNQIPFKIARSYWIYDVPGGETRGGHAFKENDEFIIALSGAFDVILDNDKKKPRLRLSDEQAWQEIMRLTGVTNSSDFQKLDKDQQRETLSILKDSGASVRQLQRLTGLGRGFIQRLNP